MPFGVRLVAFNQVSKDITPVSEVILAENDVYVLPLLWFEKDLQVQVELENEQNRVFTSS